MATFGGRKGRSQFVDSEGQVYKKSKARRIAYGGAPLRDLRSEPISVSGGAARAARGGDSRSLDTRRERYYDEDGRFRRQRSYQPIQRVTKQGLRRDVAYTAIALALVVMVGLCVVQHLRVSEQDSKNAALRTSVSRSVERTAQLRTQYEEASSELNIAYNAKDLGLVSSKSLPVTKLYAPMDAQVSPADRELVLPDDTLAVIYGE